MEKKSYVGPAGVQLSVAQSVVDEVGLHADGLHEQDAEESEGRGLLKHFLETAIDRLVKSL